MKHLTVKIVNSTDKDWYYKLQFKNNKQKTFNVVPNKEFTKFVVNEGEHFGREINPKDICQIKPEMFLEYLKQ